MSSTPESLVLKTEEEFKTSVESSRLPRVLLNSSIFNLIKILKEESNSLVASDQITSIRDNTAFLLHIDLTSVYNPLFSPSEYRRTRIHFRVDQYCKTSEAMRHGLSPMHFTEIYEAIHPESSDKPYIVVHGQLSTLGNYMYAEVRAYQDATRTVLSETQLSSKAIQDLEQNLIANINASRDILDNLLLEKEKRTIDLKTQVDKLDQELINVSRTLGTVHSLEQYISTADLFIQAITHLNQYSDIPDKRDTFIYNRLPAFKARAQLLKTISTLKTTEKQEEDNLLEISHTHDQVENIQDPTESTLEILATETIQTLETQQKTLDEFLKNNSDLYYVLSADFNRVLETHETILAIETNLMLAICLPNTLSQKHKKILDRLFQSMQTKVDAHYKECLTILDFGRRTANLSIIQTLFPLLETKLQKDFFEKLIDTLIHCNEEKMEEKTQKLITICDYLHNHSTLYNETILEMSNQKTYTILKEKIQICVEFKHIFDSAPGKTFDASLLFMLYLKHHLKTFVMLLRHGANANSFGMCDVTHKKMPIYTTLHCIISYHSENYLDYIQPLLQYHANPNICKSTEQMNSFYKQKLKLGLATRKLAKHFKTGEIKDFEVLRLMCGRKDFIGIDLLLPYSDINNLAVLLGFIANDKLFSTRQRPSLEPTLNVLQNKEAVDNICPLSKLESHPFFIYCLYPIATTDPEKTKVIDSYSRCFQKTHRLLIQNMQSHCMTSKFFEVSYEKFFRETEFQLLFKENDIDILCCFTACDFLLMERYNSLTNEQEKYQLAQKYVPQLCAQLFAIQQKLYSDSSYISLRKDIQLRFSMRLQAIQNSHTPTQKPALILSTFTDKKILQTLQDSTEENKVTPPPKAKSKNKKK